MKIEIATQTAGVEATQKAKDIYDKYIVLYKEFENQVNDHLKSEHNTSEVANKINTNDMSAIQALQIINQAVFFSQQLVNLYYAYYSTRLNDLSNDIALLEYTLNYDFFNDANIVDIKTQAQKEREYANFAHEILLITKEIKSKQNSFLLLGKYVENCVYTLDKYQKLIDTLDKVQAKDLWLDSKANKQVFNSVITDK